MDSAHDTVRAYDGGRTGINLEWVCLLETRQASDLESPDYGTVLNERLCLISECLGYGSHCLQTALIISLLP
jgi:hypothetical protein